MYLLIQFYVNLLGEVHFWGDRLKHGGNTAVKCCLAIYLRKKYYTKIELLNEEYLVGHCGPLWKRN